MEGAGMSQLLRLQCFNVSSDGFGAGEGQSLDHPFGHANPADLFSWAGATASWVNRADPGGTRHVDPIGTENIVPQRPTEMSGLTDDDGIGNDRPRPEGARRCDHLILERDGSSNTTRKRLVHAP